MATGRMARIYKYFSNKNEEIFKVFRIQNNKDKKRKYKPKATYKYDIKVPRDIAECKRLDDDNGDAFWMDAVRPEMEYLSNLKYFDTMHIMHRCNNLYQDITLTMLFTVKQGLKRKASLMTGGYLVNTIDHTIFSSIVKRISVKLLYVIS